MASQLETRTGREKADGRVHRETVLPERKAKQGRGGHRVLTMLIAALVLAFIVWIPVEIWGHGESTHGTPLLPGQQNQPAATPAP